MNHNDDLVARHLAGEATPEEQRALRDNAALQSEVARARRAWDAVPGLTPSGRVDTRWRRLAARIAASRRPRSVFEMPLLRAAAIAGLIAAGSAGYWLLSTLPPKAEVARLREVRTANAQRLALRLPDGTHVVLGPASRLAYDARTYGRGARAIQLEGEAYFEVQHDSAAPFQVQANRMLARDLGTRFTARAFAGEPALLAVAEGRVAISRTNDTAAVMVDPGQLGTLALSGSLSVSRNLTPEAYFAWTEGRLVFRDTPLSQVIPQLERWYDVRFAVATPSLKNRPLTASFEVESLGEALDVIALALDVAVRRSGDTVTLSARPGEAR